MDELAERRKQMEKLSDDELFAQAFEWLRRIDESYDEVLDDNLHLLRAELKYRATKAILTKCETFSASSQWEERAFAADVLAELGMKRPSERDKEWGHRQVFANEKKEILMQMLRNEIDDRVRESIILALGHFPIEEAVPFLVAHKNARNPDIRHALAWILGDYEHKSATEALLELMEDEDADVRDYATWALGSNSNADSTVVRDALFGRLSDGDSIVEHEALMGLCRRNDPRGISQLVNLLENRAPHYDLLDIAAESKSSELLPVLEAIPIEQLQDGIVRRDWERAIEACGGTSHKRD